MEEKLFLLGDEAVAQAALDSGVSGCYAYPGTPSTEIMEYVQASRQAAGSGVVREWSANEKTAMEAALGMSYAGRRAMVCMKHVGLNVAADTFMNAAITGVNGGLVVVVADDPSMHSSQNEQDSRYYGHFAQIPVLEPSDQQEAYTMVREAFDLSERYGVPVLLRLVTRLSHSRTGVRRQPPREQNPLRLPSDPKQFVLLPSIAKRRYRQLLADRPKFMEESEREDGHNSYTRYEGARRGILACGLAYNYLMENFPGGVPYHVLKVSSYPLPDKLIRQLFADSDEIIVLEEGYPFAEELLLGVPPRTEPVIRGRLDGTLPRDGELDPWLVGKALGLDLEDPEETPGLAVPRPPSFCPGCGHIDVYKALNVAMEKYGTGRVFSDIGCYTMGALPPYNAINSCVDMGASITMAVGAADAGLVPSVAVIGDSTFTHSGITGLLDAVNKKSPVTIIISDNDVTAMTGGQLPAGLGKIEQICLGVGVEKEHLHTIVPLRKHHEENVKIMEEELAYEGVSVIVARRECVRVAAARKKNKNL